MSQAKYGNRAESAYVQPLDREALSEVEDLLQRAEQNSGYVPTSYRLMGRKPELLRAFANLSSTVMRAPGEVPADLKWLLAHAVSQSAGCRYCQAHTAANSNKAGIEVKKIETLPQFETSDLFSEPERAVVALGLAAGRVPNEVGPDHMLELRRHFSDAGIIELVAVISLFGWLNRWNDTLASVLEEKPNGFAERHLAQRGWNPGKHAG